MLAAELRIVPMQILFGIVFEYIIAKFPTGPQQVGFNASKTQMPSKGEVPADFR
jgi:hypothetical protein